MIEHWRRRAWTADGVELVLREAPTAGYVHVAPRVRSIAPARLFIEAAREELARRARGATIVRADRVVTNEGAHAVIASLTAIAADRLIGRELGIVVTDDFLAVVDAAFDERRGALFRTFVAHLVRELPLSAERDRRRVEFQPPAGWAPRSRGLLTHVLAPSYPIDGTLLSVLPAELRGSDSTIKKLVYEDVLEDLEGIELLPNTQIVCPSGLVGDLVTARGRIGGQPRIVQAVILHDRRYRYVVRLESRRDIDLDDAILPVARSVRPVPERTALGSNILSHYAD